ncbi:1-phosphofructokinase family hexose kinase [Halalkalibaculum sp. DA3122]|uniref:1-phosphofructokinase family hexose kinase n=1 Tax=Halalkalibaculum sp. DA3122 TaxID=3373607 RepID=UPI0037549E51
MILAVCANPSVDSFWSFNEIDRGTTNRSSGESFFPGGKGIHVAFALRELGEEVTVLGVWGGETGRWLQESCRNNQVPTLGPSVPGWTRICITNRSSTSWDETELLGAGPELTSGQTEQFTADFRNCIEERSPEAVVLSGSAARGFDDTLYLELASISDRADIPVFVDASGPLLDHALKKQPRAVHINQHEGHELSGKEDPAEIVRWLAANCTIAAVTAGSEGLYLCVEDHLYHARHDLDQSTVTSTVGAGDCLVAGLCRAWVTTEDPCYWARYATACGSANCIHPELGLLKAEDVNQILPDVTIDILEL